MAVQSTMLQLGTVAPPFELPDTDGRLVSLDDFSDSGALLVMFISNHCPYVKHLKPSLAQLGRDYPVSEVGIVAIAANDPVRYPQDGPDAMRREKEEQGYPFPYLFDETQAVAKAYNAACTPDFYLFDAERRLLYRGQFDDSRPGNGLPVTGRDLRAAIADVRGGRPVAVKQIPSIGCSIKWRPGNEPHYA